MIVYCALNVRTGKRYIGQTKHSLPIRRGQHVSDARKDRLKNDHFRHALMSGHPILWLVLDVARDKAELDMKERFWIQHYCTHLSEYGYNARLGGQTSSFNPKIRQKMSDAAKKRCERNRPAVLESIETLRVRNRGNQHNAKTYSGFISPDGVVYTPVTNMDLFARTHNLSVRYLYKLVKKRHKHHKGWTLYEN